MKISLKDYKKSSEDYPKHFALLNKTLYSLCRKYRDHTDPAEINAKLWIIGRTYATGIERLIRSTGTQGSSLEQLSKHIYKNRKKVDGIFNHLARVAEPLTPEKLKAIAIAHGRFTKLLEDKTRKSRPPRSFASKYLHFHYPAVPIYDNYANRKLSSICRWNDEYEIFKRPKEADEEYYYFLLRFWQLYREFKKSVKPVNVRLLDVYLWNAKD